jgi:hypothetical protein
MVRTSENFEIRHGVLHATFTSGLYMGHWMRQKILVSTQAAFRFVLPQSSTLPFGDTAFPLLLNSLLWLLLRQSVLLSSLL